MGSWRRANFLLEGRHKVHSIVAGFSSNRSLEAWKSGRDRKVESSLSNDIGTTGRVVSEPR
jgi:hypothetical protein